MLPTWAACVHEALILYAANAFGLSTYLLERAHTSSVLHEAGPSRSQMARSKKAAVQFSYDTLTRQVRYVSNDSIAGAN